MNSEVTWLPEQRIALVRYKAGATLTAYDATFLIDTLVPVIGDEPFAVLADAKDLRGTDAAYRAKVGEFFKAHNQRAFIALTHMGPVIRIIVDLFRVGTGVSLKAFGDEQSAREWLRSVGFTA